MSIARRLSQAADTVIEAACAFATVALPLYFTVLTGTGYEPDKAVLLRVLAVLVAAAWMIGWAVNGSRWLPSGMAGGLVALGVALFGAYCLSTVLSIDLRLSLWGSQTRQEGLWTQAAYVMVFLAASTRLWETGRWQRLLHVAVVGSSPVVVYGLLQQVGYDPIPSTGDPNTLYWPVRSSLGQHVFLGSYLVMLIPCTAALLGMRRSATNGSGLHGSARDFAVLLGGALVAAPAAYILLIGWGVHQTVLFTVLLGFLAAFTASALWSASARGRVAGYDGPSLLYALLLVAQAACLLFTGARGAWLAFFATVPVFGFLLSWRLRQPRIWRSILILSVLAGCFLLVLNIPNGPLQPLRTVKGMNRLANITDSGGAGGSGQGRLLIWQGVGTLMTTTPSVGSAWGGPLRDVVGYGPETMHWAFEPVFPLKLRQVTSEIWTWDRAHNIFLDRVVDAGLIGLALFLALLVAFFRRVIALLRDAAESRSWLLIGAGSAVAGHLVDGFFGLETPVTLVLLWLLVGLVAAPEGANEDVPSVDAAVAGRSVVAGCAVWVLVAGVLAVVSGAEHPSLLAAVWTSAIVAGTASLAWLLLGAPQWPRRLAAPSRAALPPLAVGAALVCLALGSQIRFESAAMAERLGLTRLAQGRLIDAVGYLQTAALANGFEPQYETELGGAYLSLAGSRPAANGPEPYYGSIDARTVPTSTVAVLGRTQLLQASEQALSSANALAPLDPDTYGNLGNLYLQWQQPDRGLQEYAIAERLSPNNPRYLAQRALAELQQGHNSTAQSSAEQALRLDSTFWLAHYALAVTDSQLGESTSAKQEAGLALYWMHNFWPPPPASQVQVLKTIQNAG